MDEGPRRMHRRPQGMGAPKRTQRSHGATGFQSPQGASARTREPGTRNTWKLMAGPSAINLLLQSGSFWPKALADRPRRRLQARPPGVVAEAARAAAACVPEGEP